MPRRYDPSLLEKMKQGQQVEFYKGLPVLVKPIPEGGQPGDMDPRLYKSMKMMPLLSHFLPKPKKGLSTLEKIQPYRKMFGQYKGDIVVSEGVVTEEVSVPSADGYMVPVRIYKRTDAGQELPILVYYHGGGFFGGGVQIVEQMCKVLVANLDCVVLNVDYRLCPEAHYPQPFDDCWYATRWAWEHAEELGGDRNKLAVAGDSAGGNLAAAITLRDRDEATGMVKLQVLLYPAVNISGQHTAFYHGVDYEKYRRSPRHKRVLDCVLKLMGSMLGGDENLLEQVYLQGYLPVGSIYASPLLDDFHALPPTMVIFGEHDMLAFEDIAYALTAHEAKVSLQTIVYEGISHGFADQIGVMPQAEDCMKEIAAYMQTLFG